MQTTDDLRVIRALLEMTRKKSQGAEFSIMVLSLGLKPAARMKVFQFGYCSLQLGCLAESMNSKIKNTALEVLARNWYLCYSMSSPTTHLQFHPPGQQQCLHEGSLAPLTLWNQFGVTDLLLEKTDDAILQTIHLFMLLVTSIRVAFSLLCRHFTTV